MSGQFVFKRIRTSSPPGAVTLRQQFPVLWNLLTDEQHRLQRRAYGLWNTDDCRLAAAVVVQFHDSPGGCRIWLTKLSVARHQQHAVEEVETLVLRGLQAEVSKWQVPLLVLSIPEYTDFLRGLGFVAWRLHRAVSVPATHLPPQPGPINPPTPNDTTTETSAPPRISDCWAMLWMPPEPEASDDLT